jgi:hypothetical protein
MLSKKRISSAGGNFQITYVGGTTATITPSTSTTTNVSLTSLTGGIASAPITGDIVIVYYGTGSAAARNISVTGYTQVSKLTATDIEYTNLYVGYKVMGVTPDTQLTASATLNAADAGAVVVQVWRGVDTVFPLDVTSTTATSLNSALCNPPAITPITAGSVIVAGGAAAHTQGVITFGSSNLSNFTTLGGPDSTNDVTVGVGSKQWTAGAFDPAAFTFGAADSTNFSWAAVTLALSPNNPQPGPFVVSQATTLKAGATGSTITANKPAGTRQGDLLVAFLNSGPSGTEGTWTGDSGWTEIADQGGAPSTRIAYKVAGASEGASYTFTHSVAGQMTAIIANFRNAAYDTIGTLIGGNTSLAPSVTTGARYSRVLGHAANVNASVIIDQIAAAQRIARDGDSSAPSTIVVQEPTLFNINQAVTLSAFQVGNSAGVSAVALSIKPATTYTKYANYIAHTQDFNAGGTSRTISVPTARVPGNLLLLVVSVAVHTATNVTVNTPSGWTLLSGDSTSTTAFTPGLYVFYREATGGETASYSVSVSNTAPFVLSMICVGGVDVSTLRASAINSGGSTADITANEVTAVTNGISFFIGAQGNSNQGVVTFTAPSGMTEVVDVGANGSSADVSLTVAYQEGLSAGATGNKTATASANAGTNYFRALMVTVDPK